MKERVKETNDKERITGGRVAYERDGEWQKRERRLFQKEEGGKGKRKESKVLEDLGISSLEVSDLEVPI